MDRPHGENGKRRPDAVPGEATLCAAATSCTFVRSYYRMISLLIARSNTSDLAVLAIMDGARRCSIEGMVRFN